MIYPARVPPRFAGERRKIRERERDIRFLLFEEIGRWASLFLMRKLLPTARPRILNILTEVGTYKPKVVAFTGKHFVRWVLRPASATKAMDFNRSSFRFLLLALYFCLVWGNCGCLAGS